MSENFVYELESIRGLAALMVVFFHIPAWNADFYGINAVRNSYLMAQLFFVLSGFVIYRSYADRIVNVASVVRFQFLRFARLYPVHLLFFLLFFVMLNASRLTASFIGSHATGPVYQNHWAPVVEQLLLVQAIGPSGNALSFNNPAWSISVEFYTYLVFAGIVLLFRSARLWIFGLLAVISLLAQMNGWLPGFADLTNCFAGFFLGCLTAFVSSRFRPRIAPAGAWVCLGGLAAFIALKTPSTRLDVAIYFLSAMLILALTGPVDGSLRAILRMRRVRYLGQISYSIYMSHALVIALAEKVLRVGLHRTALSHTGAFVAYLLIVAIVIALSALTYTTIEKPIREAARAFASPTRPSAVLIPAPGPYRGF